MITAPTGKLSTEWSKIRGLLDDYNMVTAHDIHRPRACCRYHREEVQGPQVTSRRLRVPIIQYEHTEYPWLTDKSPSVTSLVYLHTRSRDICGIAEEWQPHIFDMQVIECLVQRSVELVSLIRHVSSR